jgi:hemolysin activation/secretion protein
MSYKLGEEFSDSDSKGNSYVTSAYLLHPFVRSRAINVYGHLEYDHKTIRDSAAEVTTDKRIDSATMALAIDGRDEILGGGTYGLTLSGYLGSLDIQSSDARDKDAETAQTNGQYEKGNISAWRLQSLVGDLSGYLAFNGQISSKNLDSSEKFILGGPTGVRSYPQGEAAGDKGYIINAELRYALNRILPSKVPGTVEFVGFIDYGMSCINKDLWEGADSTSNTRYLSGYGPGLNWGAKHFYVKTSYGWKLGHEAATSDVDHSGRFWIQAFAIF